jgi:polysaccharide pyruvyl transferase WcaK-like protein
MTIDIRGTNTVNKGAQLMLEAAVERLSPHFGLSAPPIQSDYAVRASLGLQQTLHTYKRPITFTALGNRVPHGLRRRYGLASDNDITGIVDASGFSYSDSFGAARSQREATYGKAWTRRGLPWIMLPQAFGPFKNGETRKWARQLLDGVDLVFVRDRVSQAFLTDLGIQTEVVLSPDFTIGLRATPTERVSTGPYLAIVPNAKMLTTKAVTEKAYLSSLAAYAEAGRANGLEPIIVIHESGDRALAQDLHRTTGAATYENEEPRQLKSVLGQAELVVSSRFHAVVGGLSQGVPTIAYGWSHKYKELLADFGVQEWAATPEANVQAIVTNVIADSAGFARLTENKESLLARNEEMWARTIDLLKNKSQR